MGRVRSGLRRLRARTAGELPDEAGFTLIEMMVALTILAVTMISLAYGLFGGMRVLQAGRHETSFLELANAEAESIRALPYYDAGVNVNDPNLAAAYPLAGGLNTHNGREAVVIDPPSARTPPAVEVITSSPLSSRPTPYTIRRWVTWTDPSAGTTQRFKRIDITIEWNEPNGRARSVSYTTLYYPGNLGPAEEQLPVARLTASPTSGFAGSTSFAFNGSTSSDPNGAAITDYTWDFGDGVTATGATASHTYATVGRKTVTLVVKNDLGVVSEPASETVMVGTAPGTPAPPGNLPPSAAFAATPLLDPPPGPGLFPGGPGPLSLSVDASSSSDPNGDPLTYTWIWGDGTIPNGRGSASGHVYENQGVYTLTLVVTDPAGASASASTTVEVLTPTCTIASASFKNPVGSATDNTIKVGTNDRPLNTGFEFRAVTNLQCTGMTVSLPTQSGSFNATLVHDSTVGSQKHWLATATDGSKYNTGGSQSGTFTATGDAGAVPLSISFAVTS